MRFFKYFLLLSFAFIITLFGCAKVNPLHSKVSELRSDLFSGSSQNVYLSACYGFKETPYHNDAKIGNRTYILHFKLNAATPNTTYSVSLDYDGQKFQSDFILNPVTHNLSAEFEIENFSLKEFDVTVSFGSASENVTMRSILPENTMDYKCALDNLYKTQRAWIDNYIDQNGIFNAEIYARVIVKEDKPYWYIAVASGSDNLKALLIDGFTGEVLAIREIF